MKKNWKKILLSVLSVCYLLVVFYATFLTRGSYYGSTSVLRPFASYVEAWNRWSMQEWRNIILNIFLFVPFGFLLPLWSDKLKKCWKVVLCGFLLTLAIETAQFGLKRGIFEMDDLIGNTFGVWIGYGFFTIYYELLKNKKISIRKFFKGLIPAGIMCLVFGGIFGAYSIKEFGNLTSQYTQKADMERIKITAECEFSDEEREVPIYQTVVGTIEDEKKVAEELAEKKDRKIDDSQTQYYNGTTVFRTLSENGESGYSIWVDAKGLTYWYTDFSYMDEGITESVGASENDIRKALSVLGVDLPAGSEFIERGNGDYEFVVSMAKDGEEIIDGTLQCQYYSDGEIKGIRNNLIRGKMYRDGEIISEAEAFRRLQDGKFHAVMQEGEEWDVTIKNVKLKYELDSKGYYQPVYKFAFVNGEIEDEGFTVPALK